MTPLELDHLLYLTNRRYRRLLHARLRRHSAGLGRVNVWHEGDGSCCERQPWVLTLMALTQALDADGQRAVPVVSG